MTTMTVSIDNAALRRLLHNSNGTPGQNLLRISNQIRNAAAPNAPVDTGLLRSTIHVREVPGSDPLRCEVVASTHYAIFVHEGTRYMPGRPFLTDAARSVIG